MKHPMRITFIPGSDLNLELDLLDLEYGQTVDDLKAEITNRTGLRDFILLNIHNKPFPLSMTFRHATIVKIELKESFMFDESNQSVQPV